MSGSRHETLSQLFLEAIELDPEDQAAFLEKECPDDPGLRAEVLDLLARDRAGGPLDPLASRPALPEVAGYRVLRELGRGGMGVVYEATQEAPARNVALKVLRRDFTGSTRARRFAHEANVLAQLENPAIARIYQIGTLDGPDALPFFAMELVHGLPLQQYAESRALGLRDRLELFARICDGVEYAHQKGIIHRDLKPGNILVTEAGEPKILDFGIARAIHSDEATVTAQTDLGQIVGTLPYMSPEQATGPGSALDTRTDVYSLGVVLYQLLAGRLPYDLSDRALPEAVRIIRDVDPPPLGAVRPELKGDVQTIAAKALDKDREHRYQTAAELGADVRRFLRDEPIVASPTSTFQALRKFARRNKALVAGLAAAVVALVAGTVVSILFAVSAGEERTRAKASAEESARQATLARREAKTARRFVDFVVDTLKRVDPNVAPGEEPTLRAGLDAVAARLEKDLAEEPIIRARLHTFLGNMYRSVGRGELSGTHNERALEIYREAGVNDADMVDALYGSSWFLFKAGRLPDAEARLAEALRLLKAAGAESSAVAASCLCTQAEIAMLKRDYATAQARADEALALRRRILPPDHDDLAVSLLICGHVCARRQDQKQAGKHLQESLDIRVRLCGDDHPLVGEVLEALAHVKYQQQDLDGAEALMRRTLSIREKTLPRGHPALGTGYANLGAINQERMAYDAALECFEKAVTLHREGYGADAPQIGEVLTRRATVLGLAGRFEEAEATGREAIEALTKHHGSSGRAVLVARVSLAQILRQSRPKEAREVFMAAMRDLEDVPPEISASILRLETGLLACELGEFATAERIISDALKKADGGMKLEPARRQAAYDALVRVYTALGKPAEIERYQALRASSRPESRR